MRRRDSIAALAAWAAASALPRFALAQAPAKTPRVAILLFGSRANFAEREKAFMRGMRELGYEEGRNVRYEWRSANGQWELTRTLAQELADQKVDVILSAATVTTRALHDATKTVPVVMGASEDPVAEGFVRDLARPGTNITGIHASVLDQIPRQIDLLAQLAPRTKRLVVLINPAHAMYQSYRSRLEASLRPGMRLAITEVHSREEIDRTFDSRSRSETDAMIVMNDPVLYNERRTIAEHAAKLKLPAVYPLRGFAEAGGLASVGPSPDANFHRAAAFVDKILKGAKPADIPVEPAVRFELVVNRSAARDLKIEIPPQILKQATTIVD